MTKSGRGGRPKRPPIKHTKTFSGCWTCRDRHVKCDERQPSCARCLKGGFECQGYGVKLVWVDPDSQEWEQNKRRTLGKPELYDDESAFLTVDVAWALSAIDLTTADDRVVGHEHHGPFSVFAARSGDGYIPVVTDDMDTVPDAVHGDGVHWGKGTEDTGFLDGEDDEEFETIYSPSVLASTRETLSAELVVYNGARRHHQYLPLTHTLDILPESAPQRELIHHWTNFICWHLVPVDRADNIFRSVFTPMALAGFDNSSRRSSGQIALFHALCATAAYSRSQLLNGDAVATELAEKHSHSALVHLRRSLADLNNSDEIQRASILATITTCSTMDMITGRTEWRTHLLGGASWLATIEGKLWNQDKTSSMVLQGYLAIAALCNIPLPSSIDVESDDFFDTKHYVLDHFFGLTKPILKHIVIMNRLVRQLAHTSTEDLDELELQLLAQKPDKLDLDGFEPRMKQLTRHHAYVFWYATIIYFQRTVRRIAPDSIQWLVEYAIDHLEEIERLGGDNIGCTLVWPPLVVASECLSPDLQDRILAWYQLKRRHGFTNLNMSKEIARELWRRRSLASPDEDIHWQDVLKDLEMDIILA